MNALGGENTESKTISPDVRDALRAAIESRAEAVRMARNDSVERAAEAQSAGASEGGSGVAQSSVVDGQGAGGGGVSNEPIGTVDNIAIDWGRLPPRVARDLRDSLREGTPGEYRDQVNAYFRMVAERASGSAGR
jgi:hypothetical protein